MATKLQIITELSERTTRKLTNTYENWLAFLHTAAWNYKYSFAEQVLIHAQRPDATACAPIELWNERFHRWVKKGSRGIALIDDSGSKLRLRHVFDVSDTDSRRGDPVYIWSMGKRYEDAVTETLGNGFGELENSTNLADALISASGNIMDDNFVDYLSELMNVRQDSFLEELDDLNVEVELKRALKASVSYMLLTRCGIDASYYLDRENFATVWDFNTLPVISLLGNAASDISEMALREIGSTVRSQYIEEHRAEKFALSQNTAQNRNRTENTERGAEHGNDLHDAGRLSAARPDASGAAEHREIWDAAKIVPERAPESDIYEPAAVRETDGAPGGDRPDGAGARGTDDLADGWDGGREREDESRRPDEVDRPDEQPEALGGGNSPGGADLRLTTKQLDEPEGGEPSGSLLDTTVLRNVAKQISYMLPLGSTVWIGRDEYEILAFSDDKVTLYDPSFPLFNKELSRDVFESRLRENPQNDHLIVRKPAEAKKPEEAPPLAPATAVGRDLYNSLKGQNPDYIIALQMGPYYEIYGEDVKAAQSAMGTKILTRDIPGVGAVEMTGFRTDDWQSFSHRLWSKGHSVLIAGVDDKGNSEIVKRFEAQEYIPIGTRLTIDERKFIVESVDFAADKVSLRDVTFEGSAGFPIFRSESIEFVRSFYEEQPPQEPTLAEILQDAEITVDGDTVTIEKPGTGEDTKHYAELDVTVPDNMPQSDIAKPQPEELRPSWEAHPVSSAGTSADDGDRINFHITDDELGYGGPKTKYGFNIAAIRTLQQIEAEGRLATAEEQEVLSRYVGWGGIPDAFDENKPEWAKEYAELKGLLSDDEYRSARESVLNAHYTSPVVIKAIYSALEGMGFRTGNILEPGCGVGNFLGLVPESMENSRLYGIEIDSITGRIARQLYQRADIRVQGFETADLPDSFFDVAVGNVPFGQYSVPDKRYDKLKLSIHDYFFIKTLDKVRPGGVVAFITSSFTMDKKTSSVRKYIAERAELLGAVRLPNNAFLKNAGTTVVTDILFLQKRDRPIETEPDWIHLGKTEDGFDINQYFIDNPDMVLGQLTEESTQYGHMACTCTPIPGAELSEQLRDAMANIHAEITEYDVEDLAENEEMSIPADPEVRNFSFTVRDGKIYYRENSRMNPVESSATGENRIKGMVELRDCVRQLIEYQTEDYSDEDIRQEQARLNDLYDRFTKKYGLLSSRANSTVFSDDSSYPLLCSLEVVDDEGNLERKADMFSKRTIRRRTEVTHVDTASEALAVSIGERACVDLGFMSSLMGKPGDIDSIIDELRGVIYKDPEAGDDPYTGWQTADEYLSGNVRTKLAVARKAAQAAPALAVNAEALEAVQPEDLSAAEISVRLGATWLPPDVVEQFVHELLSPAFYIQRNIKVHYMPYTSEWNIEGKNQDRSNVKANATYGTERASAYKIIEQTLNLRDVRVFDPVYDNNGNRTYVLNKKETAIARQKQALIKQEFTDWIWKDPDRRERLCRLYNDKFNSTRPREYDGRHIQFVGMNPEIELRTHQINAVARELYGGNTLLAHVVGAGKTYEMIAAAMEAKRLGLCQKSMIVVPNHLTEQWLRP